MLETLLYQYYIVRTSDSSGNHSLHVARITFHLIDESHSYAGAIFQTKRPSNLAIESQFR